MDCIAAASRREAVLEEWLLRFFLFSAAGWLWEVLLTVWTSGCWVNRGFLHGPWLPVYGIGGVLLAALLGQRHRNAMVCLLLSALLGGAVEYGTALTLEHWYRQRWWDYTGWTGSIQGRVCLVSLVGFALAGWAVSRLEPVLARKFAGMPRGLRTLLCRSAALLFALDWSLSLLHPNTGVGVTSPL